MSPSLQNQVEVVKCWASRPSMCLLLMVDLELAPHCGLLPASGAEDPVGCRGPEGLESVLGPNP